MNTNVVGILNWDYLDPLYLGATGGIVVGIFFGRPVVGYLVGVSLGYGLSEYLSRSSGNDGDSECRPENTSAMPPPSVRAVDHHSLDSDSEAPTDPGQCARSLPYMRRSPSQLQCARSLPYMRRSPGRLQGGHLATVSG